MSSSQRSNSKEMVQSDEVGMRSKKGRTGKKEKSITRRKTLKKDKERKHGKRQEGISRKEGETKSKNVGKGREKSGSLETSVKKKKKKSVANFYVSDDDDLNPLDDKQASENLVKEAKDIIEWGEMIGLEAMDESARKEGAGFLTGMLKECKEHRKHNKVQK